MWQLPCIPSSPGRLGNSGKRSTWLLSLADLVTLLLAVTSVSLTAGNLDSFTSQRGGVKEGSSGVGIQIAHTPTETVGMTVFLFREQFVGIDQELSAEAVKFLKSNMNHQSSATRELEVMSCEAGTSNLEWHGSMLRLLTLHRHLFDGKPKGRGEVKMVVLGKHCELLGYSGTSEGQPVLAIRVREKDMT
ncbi:MAG: hypothetical protein KDD70_07830 [Bdellovibrionales bacterium]|nr:hypothetical protein [Bdellovibrionales bacterium]